MVLENNENIEPKDVIMLILGVQNEIVGFTRFMKYLFLVCETKIFDKNKLAIHWESHHYGPYWRGFDSSVDRLASENLLEMEKQSTPSGNATTRFLITTRGRQHFRELSKKYENELGDITELIHTHRKSPLPVLLKFVYEQYPEYTTNSKIKNEVLDNF